MNTFVSLSVKEQVNESLLKSKKVESWPLKIILYWFHQFIPRSIYSFSTYYNSLELMCFMHTWYLTLATLVSKFSDWCQKKCELVCFGVKIMIFCFCGVKKSGFSVFLVSVENGAGVNKMTNMSYALWVKTPAKKRHLMCLSWWWLWQFHQGGWHHQQGGRHHYVGPTAWSPEGRKGRSRAGRKGHKLEFGAQRAPRFLVIFF